MNRSDILNHELVDIHARVELSPVVRLGNEQTSAEHHKNQSERDADQGQRGGALGSSVIVVVQAEEGLGIHRARILVPEHRNVGEAAVTCGRCESGSGHHASLLTGDNVRKNGSSFNPHVDLQCSSVCGRVGIRIRYGKEFPRKHKINP